MFDIGYCSSSGRETLDRVEGKEEKKDIWWGERCGVRM